MSEKHDWNGIWKLKRCIFCARKKFWKTLIFLHLPMLYCTAKRYINPKIRIRMIFVSFDDFLNFDNIQKKVNWGFAASSYRKSMIETAFESWNTILLHKKNFIEKFWFILLIHTLLWCTSMKKFPQFFIKKWAKMQIFEN